MAARLHPGTPLIERGEEGSFDWGCVYAGAYPLLRDGRLQLYYGGSDGPHTDWRSAYLGLATLRPDGFAGLTPASIRHRPLRSSRSLYCAADANSASAPTRTAARSERRSRMSMARPWPIRVPVQADVTDQPLAMARWPGSVRAGGPGNSAYLRTAGRNALFLLFQRLTPCLYSGPSAA